MENTIQKTEWITPEQRWGKQWDLFLVVLTLLECAYFIVAWWGIFDAQYKVGAYNRMPLTMLLLMASFFLVIKTISYIDEIVRRLWLRSYVIDDNEPNILKVFGWVPFLDAERVEQELLSLRAGYQIVQNSRELYGCPMAAVPAGNNQNHKGGL